MTQKFAINYPDFGELSKSFDSYRNSVSISPLLHEDAIDRVFAEAAYKARILRRVRLQWTLTIAALVIVTLAFILLLSQGQGPSPTHLTIGPSQLTAPKPSGIKATSIIPDSAPHVAKGSEHHWSKKLLIDTAPQVMKPTFGSNSLMLPNARDLEFRVSELNYPDSVDLDSAVAHDPALGPGWQVADWQELVGYSWKHPIRELIDSLKWDVSDSTSATIEPTQFWIRYLGRTTVPANPRRHYFVARWDHHPPSWFNAHADIDSKQLVLGSWYGWNFKVLAARKQDFH